MKKKFLIYTVALMMFASSWVGVFAADEVTGGDSQAPQQGDQIEQNDQDLELEPLDNEAVDSESTEPTDESAVVEEDQATGETEASSEEPTSETAMPEVEKLGEAASGAFNIKVTEFHSTGMNVDWSGSNSLPASTNYIISVAETNWSKNVGTAKSFKLGGLTPGKKYTIGVATADNQYADEITFTPLAKVKPGTLSGYHQIKIQWTGVATGGATVKYKTTIGKKDLSSGIKYDKTAKKWYVVGKGAKVGTKYSYRVRTTETAKDAKGASYTVVSTDYTDVSDKCVSPMYITIKLKRNRTFTSLDKPKKKLRLKKNTKIKSNGYGGGCYYFSWGGRKYRVSRVSTKKAKASYIYEKEKRGKMIESAWNYSPAEAEFFAEGYMAKNGKSGKKYAVWVSFYTQRLYILQNQGGNKWKCIKNWNCATGKASTPSPTGNKSIGKKKRKHHGIGWWSSFSSKKSIANSLHGNTGKWILGNPQSHGCIRNMPNNAKWIYQNVSYGSKVINY